MRGAEVGGRGVGIGLVDRRVPELVGTPQQCVEGCGAITTLLREGRPTCEACGDELDWLAQVYDEKERRLALDRAKPKAPSDWPYMLATVAAVALLLWMFRGFFIECLITWFGGGR